MPSTLLWLEETELPFSRAERPAVFYQSHVNFFSHLDQNTFFFYERPTMYHSDCLSPALEKTAVCDLICLFVVDELQSMCICFMLI